MAELVFVFSFISVFVFRFVFVFISCVVVSDILSLDLQLKTLILAAMAKFSQGGQRSFSQPTLRLSFDIYDLHRFLNFCISIFVFEFAFVFVFVFVLIFVFL